MSTTSSQEYPEPNGAEDPDEAGTQPAPLERAEPEAPYELADATDAGETTGPDEPAAGATAPAATDTPATADALAPDETGTVGSPYDEPGAPSVLSADSAARQHRVERPVPRSGLTEQHSAGYLTGDRVPPSEPPAGHAPQPEEPAAQTVDLPAGTGAAAGGAAAGAAPGPGEQPARRSWSATPAATRPEDGGPDTAVILEGATVEPTVRSRAKAHWLGVLVTIVLLPVAWYLLADGGARLTLPAGSPWQTGNVNVAALLELAGGLAVLAVVLLAARWSSVGSILAGSLVLVLGVPFVAVPQWTQELLEPALEWLRDWNDLGANLAHHLVASGSTGRLVVYGLALILLGVVSHGARRQGRREAIARSRVERD